MRTGAEIDSFRTSGVVIRHGRPSCLSHHVCGTRRHRSVVGIVGRQRGLLVGQIGSIVDHFASCARMVYINNKTRVITRTIGGLAGIPSRHFCLDSSPRFSLIVKVVGVGNNIAGR